MAEANGHPPSMPIAVPIRLRASGGRCHAWYSAFGITLCGCILAPSHVAIVEGPVNCSRCKRYLKTPPQPVQVLYDGIVMAGLLLARSMRSFMVVIRRPTICWVPHKAVMFLQEQPAKEERRDQPERPAARLPHRGPVEWYEPALLRAGHYSSAKSRRAAQRRKRKEALTPP